MYPPPSVREPPFCLFWLPKVQKPGKNPGYLKLSYMGNQYARKTGKKIEKRQKK
jgi:hypothetical protein